MEYRGSFGVEDASGARFQVDEYRIRRLFRPRACFILENGELMERTEHGDFTIVASGETLVRTPPADGLGRALRVGRQGLAPLPAPSFGAFDR